MPERVPGVAGAVGNLVIASELADLCQAVAGVVVWALATRVDVKGGSVVVVEGTESLEGRAGRAQGDVASDDVHNVVHRDDTDHAVVAVDYRQGDDIVAAVVVQCGTDDGTVAEVSIHVEVIVRPDRFRPLLVDDDIVYGVGRDELDVESVRAYRIEG